MRFTERAIFLPDNRVMSWAQSQPYNPQWRRTDWRRQDRGLHPLEHVLQELAMLEDSPQRGCSQSRHNIPEHQRYSPYHRTGCFQIANRPTVQHLKDRCYQSSRSQSMPERRRYGPYHPEYAGCLRIVRRPTVQDPKKDSEGAAGRLVPHTDQAQWHTSFDMSGFKPFNIKVNVENRKVHLSAKHEERNGSSFSVSEVSRSERLPGDVDVGSVTAWLDNNGVMHVTANRRPQPPEALQSGKDALPQPEGAGPNMTSAAEDIVVQVCPNGERNVHVAVEDPKTDSTGQRVNHSGESGETANATSLCTGTEDMDAAHTESTQKESTDTGSSPPEHCPEELSNKAQQQDADPKDADIILIHDASDKAQEDADPKDADIILVHDATSAIPGAPGSPKGGDGAESEEVMVVDDKAAHQDMTPDVENPTHHEAPCPHKDNHTTLVENPSTVPTDTPFRVTLNMSTFDPEDLQVRVCGRQVQVTAERSLPHPDGSTMYRRYAKTFPLPPSADTHSVTSVMTSEGQLTVTATSRRPEPEDRVVVIERVEN